MSKIGLIWRTVRYLKLRQLVYQVLNWLRGRATLRLPKNVPTGHFLTVPSADKPASYANQTFTFLNQSIDFIATIDWNYSDNGKLWTYNLTYFDYLNQPGMTVSEGLLLIQGFMAQTESLKDGLEPYPTSLRIINWVQFLSRHQIQDKTIDSHLFAQTDLLRRRLEYHLAGNHLLENGFALLLGALYFQHTSWFGSASRLIRQELTTQLLADGAHDERSPMYHQILLDRLLDVLLVVRSDSWHTDQDFIHFLSRKAALMLAWLNTITFANGDVPMANDSAWGVAPTTVQIRAKAKFLLLPSEQGVKCKGSGYRMFRHTRYELFADVGAVGPGHQPGHAHADTCSFILYVDNQPVLVDSGTSTYQIGPRRSWERSTAAHNTVEVAGLNSSEVWGGFRVGRRAEVTMLADTEYTLSARHNGYGHVGITHERTWQFSPTQLEILDRVSTNARATRRPLVARFYFHADIQVALMNNFVTAGLVTLTLSSSSRLTLVLKSYGMAAGFNIVRPAQCLEVTFVDDLKTAVTIR